MRVDNLRRLGNSITVSIPKDEKGFIGRLCPSDDCGKYFKLEPGTGLKGDNLPCYCPYCGFRGEPHEFATEAQIEYAKSIALRKITDAIHKDLKKMEFDIKPKGDLGIGLSLKIKRQNVPLIKYYQEEELETEIICAKCTLRYAIYGVFAYCPDCASRNSMQILYANFELVQKQLELAEKEGGDLGRQLIDNSLEDAVSAFDAFGREVCRSYSNKKTINSSISAVSFQNLDGARNKLQCLLNIDLISLIGNNSWKELCKNFQKRHLLSHCLGVVDQSYIDKTGDTATQIGHKIEISIEDVRFTVKTLKKLGEEMTKIFLI